MNLFSFRTCLFFSLTLLYPSFVFAEPIILRGPYLQNITPTSVTIIWHQNESAQGSLEYWNEGKRKKVPLMLDTENVLTLTDLKPNSLYRYKITTGNTNISPLSPFRTPPRNRRNRARTRIAIIGDSGSGTSNQLAVAQQLASWKPHLMLHTGDVVYSRGEQENYNPRFFGPYQNTLRSAPIFPSIGNHDTGNINVYLENFILPSSGSGTERYYSFNYGPIHFVALDSNLPYDPSSEQFSWLEADLDGTHNHWVIIYFHHPAFSSSHHGNTNTVISSLVPLFERCRVDLVLNGHDHNYERFAPINLTGVQKRGVRYIVTGGGGRKLYSQTIEQEESKFFLSQYHFLTLRIRARQLIGSAISLRGKTLDRFRIRRRPGKRGCLPNQ